MSEQKLDLTNKLKEKEKEMDDIKVQLSLHWQSLAQQLPQGRVLFPVLAGMVLYN
jgi:predicted transcriptional regulator